ncbi:MAG TPA: acetyl-coenzyme A synthetase N-terminal domain-containing protein, partial [Saprospiraceae bacterium]|nr:acetyl-coenzyme A synthetase N-terminal domain-containing protein [Saprospiraceae bacterium]
MKSPELREQEVLWNPSAELIRDSRLTEFRKWLNANHQLAFETYESLWQWSVDDPAFFWEYLASFFKVKFHAPYHKVLSDHPMPEARWFEGATLNYAEHIFLGLQQQESAILFVSESGIRKVIPTHVLWKEVGKMVAYFKQHGVRPGDRIAGYLPTIPEATYAFLAAASIGAIWSCCSQDFGVSSVVDRFAQIEPVLLITADGYQYNGKVHDKSNEAHAIQESLPSLRNSLWISNLGAKNPLDRSTSYSDLA